MQRLRARARDHDDGARRHRAHHLRGRRDGDGASGAADVPQPRWEFVGTYDDNGGRVNDAGEWIATATAQCKFITPYPHIGGMPNGTGLFRTWAKGTWDGTLDNQAVISTVTSAPVALPCAG